MLSQNHNKQSSFQLIFIMLLFLIIVVMSVMIILHGQKIYESINEDRSYNYEKRVSLSYIANKVRQADRENSIRIENSGDIQSLVIRELYDGDYYETWIYFYNGGLYELFAGEGIPFNPDDGMKIMDVDSFSIERLNNKLYKFTAGYDKYNAELIINVNSGQSRGAL
ncbi:DUF4860 domain-containing protein [Sedimentibacter sp.]|uniref:DUF4860 domain-containing protein n=1 Tax=Sedimentibacter sp. TaxID=1960295 RepID=UPI002897273A|nr:DUF4860 domain-containing protein [Sedimentibacter sp.]